ncbi:hypothetical protein KY289_030673 [Solanum tuberosum]|nr:hypothetical protein KY289_030673 [Solanum tuberosum]
MDDLAEVYPDLNVPRCAPNDVYSQVMGSDAHGIVRTLGKGASPSLVYGPVRDNSLEDCQQSLSHVPIVQTKKAYLDVVWNFLIGFILRSITKSSRGITFISLNIARGFIVFTSMSYSNQLPFIILDY